ncbi:MAG: FG-GAP repeat protein, partial [Thermoplasmata archaeon]|nr:FG-GAP repeat protein [Thermoplasmata archaeon]
TYLILGKASRWSRDTDLSKANASFMGEGAMDLSGYSVAGAGDVNLDGYDDIMIGAPKNGEATDYAGQTYLVLDNLAPKILNDATPTYAYTGDEFTFNISATDNFGVKGVSFELWYGDIQDHQSSPANLSSGDLLNGTWILDIYIPSNATELHYIINVTDEANVSTRSQTKDIVVHDNDPPVLDDDTLTTASTGDTHIFTIEATDNINLTDVHVEYWYGGLGAHTNISMTRQPGDLWNHSIIVPSDSIETLHYYFYAEDRSTNIATTRTRDIPVIDNDLPIILGDRTPAHGTTGDPFTISISAIDNIGIENVTLSYTYGDWPTTDAFLSRGNGDLWEATITIEHTPEDMKYVITVRDSSGNENATGARTVTFSDNDSPWVVEDLSDTVATTGDVFHGRVRVRDNIGIVSVSSVAPWTPIDVDEAGNGVYEFEIPIDVDYVGRFYLGITVTDLSGNEGYFELSSREVVDDDPPEIDYEHILAEFPRGSYLNLSAHATDNIGVDGLFIFYRYGSGEVVNESFEARIELDLPRLPEGDLLFSFSAVDGAGNW